MRREEKMCSSYMKRERIKAKVEREFQMRRTDRTVTNELNVDSSCRKRTKGWVAFILLCHRVQVVTVSDREERENSIEMNSK